MSKTINAGRVTFVPKDNFSNNISYKKFDIVTYNGSSYFAKKDTIGHTPTEDEFWQLVAEKGQNGAPGADLSNYYTKEESDEKLLTKQDKLPIYYASVYTPIKDLLPIFNSWLSDYKRTNMMPMFSMGYSDTPYTGNSMYLKSVEYNNTTKLWYFNFSSTIGELSAPITQEIYMLSYDSENEVFLRCQKAGHNGQYLTPMYDFSKGASFGKRALSTTNTEEYTPTSDYHPATKKYVDDNVKTYTAGDNITISEDNVISSNIGLPVLENQEINIHTFPVGSYIITGTDTVIKYGMNGASSYKPITINSHTGNTDSWVLNITHNSGGESNRGFAFLFRNYGYSGTTAFYTFDFSGMKSIDTNMIMQSNTNQNIYGQFDFYHALPISSLVPSTDNELTNKKYVDDTISAKGGDKLHDYNIYTITLDDYNLKGTFPTITDTTTLAKFDEILTDIYKKRIAANATRDHVFLIVYSQADTFIFRTSTIEASYCNLYGTYVEQPIDHKGYTCSYVFNITGTLDTTAQTFKTTKVKFDRNSKRVLLTNNTMAYTPTDDYNPATKKYVDDQVGNINTILATLTTVSEVTK